MKALQTGQGGFALSTKCFILSIVNHGKGLVRGLTVKLLQKALPFAVQKPRGKGFRLGLSKLDKTGGGAFDFALGGGRVLLCDLFCHPTEKIKHLVNGIVDQFNGWL